MKVLHCIPHLQPGGADIGTAGLVRSLNTLPDIQARLCVFRGKEARTEYLDGLTDPILLNFRGSHARPDEFVRFRAMLRRIVCDWQPEVIHSHLWPACRWASSALLGTAVKHVWHVHDTRGWLRDGGLRSRLLRQWTKGLANGLKPRLIAVSNAAARYNGEALGLDTSMFSVASVGVNTSKFVPRPAPVNHHPVIGLAAQFRPEKGHAILLRAIKRLRATGRKIQVRFAGEGELLERTKVLSRELQLNDCVEFLGTVTDIPAFLSGLDLFVLPSTESEGLPLCLLEAMSMNIPVVATAVSGSPEIVREGETGFLVAPGDERKLADGIQCALQDRDVAQRVAKKAKELVLEKHSEQAIARRVVDVYQQHATY